MQNFVSPHVHVKSLDSASTPEQFAKRELELGTGHLVVTDHGTLEATRQVYDLTRDKKAFRDLKPILGVEGYFRDDNCPFLAQVSAPRDEKGKHVGTYAKYLKYCHLTLHAMDEQAYGALSRVLSAADLRAEQHGKERKPLFTWENLEELGSHNVTMTSGCLIGMVGRHLVKNNDPHTALRYYDRLRGLVKPGNFYIEVMPHVCDRFWESKIVVDHGGGNVQKYPKYKQFKTHAEPEGIKLGALMEEYRGKGAGPTRERHKEFLEVMESRVWTPLETPLGFVSLSLQEGEVLNECRGWCPDGDVQLGLNRFLMQLAGRYGDPVLLSDDSHFAYPEEKIVQDIRLNQGDDDWRFVNSHHRMDSATAWAYAQAKLGVPEADFERWVQNTRDWASRFDDFKFSPRKTLPTSFYPKDTLRHILELVQKHGRMDWQDPVRVDRLKAELDLLTKNGVDLLPYFMIDEEVCRFYLKEGYLTGPGRGSAAGLQLAWLLGITHVDPIRYKLSMDRFMTSDRVKTGKLPDIDQDLPHRHLLISEDGKTGWLRERFGDCVAQISNDTTLRLKSSIKDTFRALERMRTGDRHARVPEHIEEFCKKLETPPQGINDQDYVFGYKDTDGNYQRGELEKNAALKKFTEEYPREWDIVCRLLGLSRQKSRHACAYVIADEPIQNFIPLQTVGDSRVTSFTAPAVEAAGGLKMDFLVVHAINDIDCALKLIRSRYDQETWQTDDEGIPYVMTEGKKLTKVQALPFQGRSVDVYDLPEDPNVFRDICEGKVETVFQLDAGAARQGLKHFAIEADGKPPIGSIEALSAFTALDRPGPLDAKPEGANHNFLVEFANRAKGKPAVGRMAILDELLPETYGVIVYQEQLQAIFQQVGETTAIDANNFRGRISKKKLVDVNKIDKPIFMKKALPKLEAAADILWNQMQTFGQYGFNKSHATCYMVTAYACAFLKRHFPLEWWTSVLNNADRAEIDEKFWRYCGHIIDLPDLRYSQPGFVIQNERIRAPLSLLVGLGQKAHAQLLENGPYESITDFLEKIEAWKRRNPLLDKAGKQVLTKAGKGRHCTSALNGGVITNLIISGVMDSLFPGTDSLGMPMRTQDRLSAWSAAKAEIASRGKKRRKEVKPVGTEFDWLKDPLAHYQARKKVLPAYSASVLDILNGDNRVFDATVGEAKCKAVMTRSQNREDPTKFRTRYWKLVTGPQYEYLGSLDVLPPVDIDVALLGYVVLDRRFDYKQKSSGEDRTACELILDVDGVRINMVRWPSKSGLPAAFNQPLQGAVVACLFTRGSNEKDFFFADVSILAAL